MQANLCRFQSLGAATILVDQSPWGGRPRLQRVSRPAGERSVWGRLPTLPTCTSIVNRPFLRPFPPLPPDRPFHPVPPLVLGAVKGGVGCTHQVVGLRHRRWLGASRSQAAGQPDLDVSGPEAFGADSVAYTFRQRQPPRRLAPRQHHQKLLAAVTAYRIVAPYRRPHACRHLAQHRIASHVAKTVVDGLKPVQI